MSVRFVFLVVLSIIVAASSAWGATTPRRTQSTPPAFERNVGQLRFEDGSPAVTIDAMTNVNGVTGYIHRGGMHMLLTRLVKDPSSTKHDPVYSSEAFRVDLELIASNPAARFEAVQQMPGTVRYLVPGGGRDGYVADRFGTLIYRDVWPGIDMRMYHTVAGLKYDFVVRPGADPQQIALRYVGGSAPVIGPQGDLVISTPLGTLGEQAPVVFTASPDGTRTAVTSSFDVRGSTVRFSLGSYDRTSELVIDPQRVWATYYGYNRSITFPRTAVDASGNVYLSGSTEATNMPNVPGVLQRRHRALVDGFVTKFDEFGQFQWHTYYGGSGNDYIRDITTDPAGTVWVCGSSNSKDLPNIEIGSNAYPVDSVQFVDGIVLRLDSKGAWLDSWQYSGRESDILTGITARADRIAVVGYTRSPAFGGQTGTAPYKKNQANFSNNTDIFMSVVKPRVSPADRWQHDYIIWYGSDGEDYSSKIGFDPQGNVIFTGSTYESSFPVTDGTTYKFLDDGVIVKFTPTATRAWASIYGTTAIDDVMDLAVDGTGAAIVVGYCPINGFPTTTPIKGTLTGASDGFIRKFNANGTIAFSTYYGGDSLDQLYGCAVDAANNIWVVGLTGRSTNIPVTPDAIQSTPNAVGIGMDGFMGKLNPAGGVVLYGSYYGAPAQDNLPPPPPPPPTPPPPAPPPNTDYGMDWLADVACDANAYVAFVSLATTYRMDTTAFAYQDSSKLDKDTLRANAFVSFFTNCKDSVIAITANGPTTLCDVDSRQLIAPTGFASYRWNTGATSRIITVSDTGSYSVVCVTADGCRYRDTLFLARNPRPRVNAGADTSACLNVAVQLTATPSGGTAPFRYKWNRIQSGPEYIDDDTLQRPSVNPNSTSTYEVTVTDAAGCIAKDTVAVTIIDPRPTGAPSAVDFGTLDACATAAEQDITITNPQAYEIRVTGFTPDDPRVSLVTSITPPIIIAPGGSTTLRVRVAPSASGTINGSFTVTGTPCVWNVRFTYRVVKQQLTATVIPGTVRFGVGVICEQTDVVDTTTIRNGGSDPLVVNAPVVAAPFSIVSPTFPVTVAPGAEQIVVFRYAPTGPGSFSAVAAFPFTSGSCSDSLRVNLIAGTSEVTVVVAPALYDVGTLSGCEDTRDTAITIDNRSDVDVTVTLPSTAEIIFAPAGPITIPSRSTQRVSVQVRPAAPGNFSQTATLTAQPCNVPIPVTFTAVKNGIAFTTPPSVAFGEFSACTPGASTTRSEQLSFDGTGTATIASVTAGPTLATTLTSGATLNPNAPLAFDVTWTPAADGPLVDSIVVVFEPCTVRRVIPVSGSRTRVALRADNPTVALGSITGSTTGTIRFTNTGTDTISVGAASRSANTFVMATRPAALTQILPGDVVEVDYRTNCASRTNVSDTIEAVVLTPCAAPSAISVLDGTCTGTQSTVSSTIALDSVGVKVGDVFTMPIRLTASQGLASNGLTAWSADVTYNPMVVVGTNGTPDCFVAGQFTPCTISVTGTRGTDTVGTIGSLTFTAVLGNADMTSLAISNFRWTGSTAANIVTRDGKVVITDICRTGGDRFLIPKTDGFSISVFPTPADKELTILVKGAGTQQITWSLANYVGTEVTSGTMTPDASGTAQTTIDTSVLGSGLYVLTTNARGATYRTTVLIAH